MNALRKLVGLTGLAATSYVAYVGAAWLRYGHPRPPGRDEADALLDRFIPRYDVVERHRINVAAPAEVTFGALMDVSLEDSRLVQAIFKGRELLLGADPAKPAQARSLVDVTRALGWVTLAHVPGREIVVGAVTKPWEPNVVFRGISADQFAAFNEPDYVKIVWNLRADVAGASTSIARTETRAIATDEGARRKFRWYWSRFSPGIVVIRSIAQHLVKKEAERRANHFGSGNSMETVVPPVSGTSM